MAHWNHRWCGYSNLRNLPTSIFIEMISSRHKSALRASRYGRLLLYVLDPYPVYISVYTGVRIGYCQFWSLETCVDRGPPMQRNITHSFFNISFHTPPLSWTSPTTHHLRPEHPPPQTTSVLNIPHHTPPLSWTSTTTHHLCPEHPPPHTTSVLNIPHHTPPLSYLLLHTLALLSGGYIHHFPLCHLERWLWRRTAVYADEEKNKLVQPNYKTNSFIL